VTLNRTALKVSLLSTLALASPGVTAAEGHGHGHDHEMRQHGAHVHGIAALNLALEGDEVHVELDTPAANIVGFEHVPSSEAEHVALDRAVATLKDGDQLFRFNVEAGCRMAEAKVNSALLDEAHGHEVHAGETHSDIDAVYRFECDQPGKLTQLTVELFDAFPGMGELNIQYITEHKQGAAELTPANHVLGF